MANILEIFKQSNFAYGETDGKLKSSPESEIYQSSAQKIENMRITTAGNLVVLKSYEPNFILPIAGKPIENETIVKVANSKYNFYSTLSYKKILYGINKDKYYVILRNIKKDTNEVVSEVYLISEVIESYPVPPNTTYDYLQLNNWNNSGIANINITTIAASGFENAKANSNFKFQLKYKFMEEVPPDVVFQNMVTKPTITVFEEPNKILYTQEIDFVSTGASINIDFTNFSNNPAIKIIVTAGSYNMNYRGNIVNLGLAVQFGKIIYIGEPVVPSDNKLVLSDINYFSNPVNFNIVENYIFISYPKNKNLIYKLDKVNNLNNLPYIYEFDKTTGLILFSDIKSKMLFPIKDKKEFQVDFWIHKEINNIQTPVKNEIVKEPILKGDIDGFLYYGGTKVDRIYVDYQTELTRENFIIPPNGYEVERLCMIIYPIQKGTNSSYVGGNVSFNFISEKTDNAGKKYFEKVDKSFSENPVSYGEIKDISTFFNDVQFFQGRLFWALEDFIYASRIDKIFDFRNDTNTQDPFYFKLTTVENNTPDVLAIKSGRGLFIATNKGLFVSGYNEAMIPANIPIRLVSDEEISAEIEVIADCLYFLNGFGILKAIQNTSKRDYILNFESSKVENYSFKNYYKIRSFKIDGKRYLYAFDLNGDNKIYEEMDLSIFRKVTLNLGNNIVPYENGYIDYNSVNIFTSGNKNMKNSKVILNAPPARTSKGGYLLNEVSSTIKKVVARITNRIGIEQVKFFNKAIEFPIEY
ncbi:MAG: hypothetical protein ACRC0V_03805, partial [Fusobacteriaceae bacterium]